MNIQRVQEKIKSINAVNGFSVGVTDVSCSSDAENLRPRGVSLSQDNGSLAIQVNAETTTLEQLKHYIADVLDSEFVVESTDDIYTLRATPKRPVNAGYKEEKDATSKTNPDNRRKGRSHRRNG